MFSSTTSEAIDNRFNVPKGALFSDIQNRLDKEMENSPLGWVYEIGWSPRFAATDDNVNPTVPGLQAISLMIEIAYEKDCHALLKSLFDALADAVREQGRGAAPKTTRCQY